MERYLESHPFCEREVSSMSHLGNWAQILKLAVLLYPCSYQQLLVLNSLTCSSIQIEGYLNEWVKSIHWYCCSSYVFYIIITKFGCWTFLTERYRKTKQSNFIFSYQVGSFLRIFFSSVLGFYLRVFWLWLILHFMNMTMSTGKKMPQ